MDTRSELERKIAALQADLLKVKQEEQERDKYGDAGKLAELIYENLFSRCDDSWYYESWQKPGNDKKKYLAVAQQLLQEFSAGDCVTIVDILKGGR